jgi:hypothetical protein
MMYRSRWFAFEIPDEWWEEAGMRGFKTDRRAYRRSLPSNADNTTILMLVDSTPARMEYSVRTTASTAAP